MNPPPGLLSNLLIDYQLSSQPSTNATPPSNPQQRLALLPEVRAH